MLRQNLVELLTNQDKSSKNALDLSIFKKDNQSFIAQILDCIPEAKYLNTKANASVEKQGEIKTEKNFYGLTEPEAIRAFSGLLRFKEVINHTEDDYQQFINCQVEMKKPVLKKASFDKMKDHIMEVLYTPEDFAAQIWSILCNDLGKVHAIIDEYKKLVGDKTIGHDGLLASILQEKPELFPGFHSLSQKHQKQIISGYASECDISMLEQLELPANALQALAVLDKETLERYILHTIYDVSGAAAVFKPNGSLTMHEETWTFFNELRLILAQLHQDKPVALEKIYQDYLQFRGQSIGISDNSRESLALMRIAGLSRLATVEQGELLKAAWNDLSKQEQAVLVDELNIHGGKGRRAIFVGYGVVMLVNPQVALKPIYQTIINQEGLKIGLKYLAKVYQLTRSEIGDDASDQIFVAECASIASVLAKNPREFIINDQLTREFEFVRTSERRIDFALKAPVLAEKQECTLAKIGLFPTPTVSVAATVKESLLQQSKL